MRLARLLAFFLASLASLHAAAPQIDRGTLPTGTPYLALKPAGWDQGRVLLFAPAQRGSTQPAEPQLDPASPFVRPLLEAGWLVATIAYRRPGVVFLDSIEDFNALRTHLANTYSPSDRVYVLGESMGAGLAVRLVENFPDDYAGAVAVGGPFDLQEPAPTLGVNFAPQRPLLLLPNQSESHAPDGYVKAAARARVPPVLWKVARDGRANINAAEKLAALAAVVRWVESGLVPAANFDATLPPPPRDSAVAFNADATNATGQVLAIDPVRGDLVVNFQPADLERLGIARGTFFAVELPSSGSAEPRIIRVLYGQNPRTAKSGDWTALPEAEGWLLFSVHRGQAAAVSGLQVGSSLTLRRLRDR